MAGNSTGKWVTRAAATGGSRAYRGQRPVNWYLSLFLIVVLGVTLVIYSRYERQNPYTGSAAGNPTTSDSYKVGFAFDICGKVEDPAATPNSSSFGIVANASGIITVAPKNPGEAGHNATFGKFVSNYKGMQVSGTSLFIPAGKGEQYTNGQKCGKGTPDAGKEGFISAMTWSSTSDNTGTAVRGNPADIHFNATGQMITVAFIPKGAAIQKPPTGVITALLTDESSSGTRSTASPTVSTPSAPTVPVAPAAAPTPAKTNTPTPAKAKTTTPTSSKSTTATSSSGGGTGK